MNGLDYILLAILLLSTAVGLLRGLIRSVTSIAVLVLGVVGATLLGPAVAPLFESSIDNAAARTVLGYFAVFAVIWIVLRVIAWLITKALESLKLSWANRLSGAGFGLLRGIVLAAMLIMALTFALDAGHPFLKQSTLRGPLDHVVGLLTGLLPDDVEQDLDKRRRALGDAFSVGRDQVGGFKDLAEKVKTGAEAAKQGLDKAAEAKQALDDAVEAGQKASDALSGE